MTGFKDMKFGLLEVILIMMWIFYMIFVLNQSTADTLSIENINISKLITIKTPEDIDMKRQQLIDFIWQGNFPDSIPIIENNKLIVNMEYGFKSVMELHKKNNRKLMIYNKGHTEDNNDRNAINYFLNNGYDVLEVSMPLIGSNNQPIVNFTRFGSIKIRNHNQLILLESKNFTPIKYFVHPLALAVNYFQDKYDEVDMVGISGGGWTTTLYAAIDPRILKSYPVAGSLPLYLRDKNDIGDYEQILPLLYNIATYEELYIMGSYNRTQLQILNEHDPCCFAGTKNTLYEDIIKITMQKLGSGNFSVYLDKNNYEHKISVGSLIQIR